MKAELIAAAKEEIAAAESGESTAEEEEVTEEVTEADTQIEVDYDYSLRPKHWRKRPRSPMPPLTTFGANWFPLFRTWIPREKQAAQDFCIRQII